MAKLKIEDLTVLSFVTGRADGVGTVRANESVVVGGGPEDEDWLDKTPVGGCASNATGCESDCTCQSGPRPPATQYSACVSGCAPYTCLATCEWSCDFLQCGPGGWP